MRKLLLLALVATVFVFESNAQSTQYKEITSVESIILIGIGRPRII